MKPPLTRLLVLTLTVLTGCEKAAPPPAGSTAPASAITEAQARTSHLEMEQWLDVLRVEDQKTNPFYSDAGIRALEQELPLIDQKTDIASYLSTAVQLGMANSDYGNLETGIRQLTEVYRFIVQRQGSAALQQQVSMELGKAYMRLGESENCCALYSPESCTLPIRGKAIHTKRRGSEGAIVHFTEAMRLAQDDEQLFAAQWLLNLAYMTLGDYQEKTPDGVRLPPSFFSSEVAFPRFENIAEKLGVATDSLAGGVVADDLDGDGDVDLMVSCWDGGTGLRYFENRIAGGQGFVDQSDRAGITKLFGGLNLLQADYDNDGDVDILVLRGAWLEKVANIPNSLLRNEGGGVFTDVTIAAGLTSQNLPTQTAVWLDFDNDGDLDVYIGNEQWGATPAPSQLFRNNGSGTFTDVAGEAGVAGHGIVKGVAAGDLDNDGWTDLVVSNFTGANRLYHNNGNSTFTDIAQQAGIGLPARSFPAWVWDYNNDGNLDIFISSYSLAPGTLARKALGHPPAGDVSGHYRGDGKNGFTNRAAQEGFDTAMLTMGCNFGDLNNDGFLDLYLGTGSPDVSVLLPNFLYLNQSGKKFVDVTMASGMGHLQKGHAVAFADFDQDGDLDVFEQMGGAKRIDHFRDCLYENPGFGTNWFRLKLTGTTSNRSAIGARIRVELSEGDRSQFIYRKVDSGASFGANPLEQHIGIGSFGAIRSLEIHWPVTGRTQRFENLSANKSYRVVEDGELTGGDR